jgi:hypothetical protein
MATMSRQDATAGPLGPRLEALKHLLDERQAPGPASPPPDGGAPQPHLRCLEQSFSLSPFESDLLLLCAGAEIDADVGRLIAKAQGDPSRSALTFGLALARLPGAHWSAIGPEAALRRWRLIDLGTGASVTQAPLRIDERVLHFLLGFGAFDERLAALMTPLAAPSGEALPPSHAALAEAVAATWASAERGAAPPIVQLCGARADCAPIAAAAARRLDLAAALIAADRLPAGAADLDSFVRLWERESALSGVGVLVLDLEESAPAEGETPRTRGVVGALLDRLTGPTILRDREPRRPGARPLANFDVPHPTHAEQLALWRASLGAAVPAAGELDRTVDQFSLAPTDIAAIGAEARAIASPPPSLWDLCRRHMRGALDGLAERVESKLKWDDLVLPDAQKRLLTDIAAQLRGRSTVYDRWGFGETSRRGRGVSALFHGPSGAGKTMAAEVLASELRLDLYHIDLSRVVSKYIGETEANLRRVFDAAEDNGAILLFDEADSLFGARSEVKDSHDRYANIEVSYLLQRMESYRGLAILTTNMRTRIDPAFLRRLRFSIAFPFPDVAERAEIWRRIFPRGADTKGLDVDKLANLRLAGGNIRNIALNAAFLAVNAEEPVQMRHVRAAAEAEYAKLERRLTQAESEAWA